MLEYLLKNRGGAAVCKTRFIAAVILPLCLLYPPLTSASSIAIASAPEAAVHDFYRWYLTQRRPDNDPVFSARKQMAHYVSRTLLRKADLNEWTCDYDYFTEAQTIDPEWVNTIAVQRARIRGNRAKLSMTLGERTPGARVAKLTLTLKKEGGLWKISGVHDDAPEHWQTDDQQEQAEDQSGDHAGDAAGAQANK